MHAVTDWLSGDQKPEYVGVYQRNYGIPACESIVYSYWDGMQWYTYGENAAQAFDRFVSGCATSYQNEPWRGCTTKQESVQYSRAGIAA